MADFDIKQGDNFPRLIANLRQSNGTIINLVDSNVLFKMKSIENGALILNTAANVINPSLGTVQYEWTSNDTSIGGEFKGEFEITFSGGEIQSVPTVGYISIKIHDDLD